MALVKYGAGVIDMRGSVAGTTFSKNRSGQYARARTKPVNPNTARQDDVRSALSLVTVRWAQTLTALKRTAWNLYASNVAMKNRLGETIYLSGFNHYIRSNVIRVLWGATPVDDGPTVFELPAQDPALAVTASELTQQLTTTYDNTLLWGNETGGYLFLEQGVPQNPQRNFFGGPWRMVGRVDGADGAPPVPPLVSPAVFPIAELQRQWIFGRTQRADGRLSEPFEADCFVGA